jgi:MFS family permease
MLIGFRVLQGIGGAVMSSLTLSLIAEAYPPEDRTGPIGLWAAVSGLAVAGGSVAGVRWSWPPAPPPAPLRGQARRQAATAQIAQV